MIRTFEELKGAVKLFDTSLKGFQGGATLPGSDGKPVFLKAAEGDKALRQMAMNQNRRLLEVAEAVLTAADVLPGRTRSLHFLAMHESVRGIGHRIWHGSCWVLFGSAPTAVRIT